MHVKFSLEREMTFYYIPRLKIKVKNIWEGTVMMLTVLLDKLT